jgi:hypothetical protein
MYTKECLIERQRLKEIKDKVKQRKRKKSVQTKKEERKEICIHTKKRDLWMMKK